MRFVRSGAVSFASCLVGALIGLLVVAACAPSVGGTSPLRPSHAPAPSEGRASPARPTGFIWPQVIGKGPLDQEPFLNVHSDAWTAYREAPDPATRALIYQIAATPTSIWLGGNPTDGAAVNQIETTASAAHETPQFVLYAIPERDCNGRHPGGLSGVTAYEQWIDSIRAGIAHRPAIVIVEPDAIGMTCLSPSARADRVQMLSYALEMLSKDPSTWVYIHAGSSRLRPDDVLQPLIDVGVQHARGFALNISSYGTVAEEEQYGDALVRALADRGVTGMHYVIDTSRDGVGRAPTGSQQALYGACNQRDRALGVRPTPITGHPGVDAFLWIKPPGETDGACFPGDPSAGWYQSYALDLVRRGLDCGTITRLQAPG